MLAANGSTANWLRIGLLVLLEPLVLIFGLGFCLWALPDTLGYSGEVIWVVLLLGLITVHLALLTGLVMFTIRAVNSPELWKRVGALVGMQVLTTIVTLLMILGPWYSTFHSD